MTQERPQEDELLVAGDVNINMKEPEGDHMEEYIAADLTILGLEDMSTHILPRPCPWYRDGRTWRMVWSEREVQFQTDYTLRIYCRLFKKVTALDPRHNSDHCLVLVCLCSVPLRDHTEYLGGRKKIPLQPPTTQTR